MTTDEKGKMSVKKSQRVAEDLEVVSAPRDGSANPNPGTGEWGVILVGDGKYTKLAGRSNKTSNNQMELTAEIQAL
jgi:ribonuclease HI